MKKIGIITILLIFTMIPAWAQTKDFNHICEKYKSMNYVKTFKINELGCMVASFLTNKEESPVGTLIQKCSSGQILICEGGKSKELYGDIKSFIHANTLEELMNIKEQEKEIKIYVQEENKTIRQLFLSLVNKQEMVFLQLNGNFSQDLLQNLAKTINCKD